MGILRKSWFTSLLIKIFSIAHLVHQVSRNIAQKRKFMKPTKIVQLQCILIIPNTTETLPTNAKCKSNDILSMENDLLLRSFFIVEMLYRRL